MKIENEEQYREALRALELIWCDDSKDDKIVLLADAIVEYENYMWLNDRPTGGELL